MSDLNLPACVLQYSDSDSEAEYPAIVPAVPSAVPVTGESYCSCESQMELGCNPRLRSYTHLRDCHCGEDDQGGDTYNINALVLPWSCLLWLNVLAVYLSDFDWVWDEGSRSSATLLSCENRKVSFHSEYSCGTAAIRGSRELSEGQHFWEIKMTSPVYGTDMVRNKIADVCLYTCTLTGHFIRYTLLVPGWTPFCLQNCLIIRGIDSTRSWKHSSEILVHIDMIASHSCCRFVGCRSMMWISRSTTSQRCSIGLRSGDCGGHLSKVN